jgi:hypothetical protein
VSVAGWLAGGRVAVVRGVVSPQHASDGRVPVQPGPTMAHAPALVPEVREPGEAKTSVQ